MLLASLFSRFAGEFIYSAAGAAAPALVHSFAGTGTQLIHSSNANQRPVALQESVRLENQTRIAKAPSWTHGINSYGVSALQYEGSHCWIMHTTLSKPI